MIKIIKDRGIKNRRRMPNGHENENQSRDKSDDEDVKVGMIKNEEDRN